MQTEVNCFLINGTFKACIPSDPKILRYREKCMFLGSNAQKKVIGNGELLKPLIHFFSGVWSKIFYLNFNISDGNRPS